MVVEEKQHCICSVCIFNTNSRFKTATARKLPSQQAPDPGSLFCELLSYKQLYIVLIGASAWLSS